MLSQSTTDIDQFPIETEAIWTPQAGSQELFLSCPLFEVLYEGTRGPGKTDALLMDFAQHVGVGFGADWRGILFRQTYKQLTDVISKSKKWFNQIFPDATFHASEHYWTFPTGEMLYLRQFMRDDDYWNYHGHSYPWIGWEELCNWATYSGYKRMMSCCRSTNPDMPRKYRSTTNPYGPGHNWVKARFRLPGSRFKPITDSRDEDGNLEPPRVAIHGTIQENKILLESDPEYITRIIASARNKAELAAWLEGSWDIVAGGMFDDVWEPSTHILPDFYKTVPHDWRIYRSFDWGSSKPFSVGWWARSNGSDLTLPNGRVMNTVPGDAFRIQEWYGATEKPNEGLRMLSKDISLGIVERELKWGLHKRVKPGPADNNIFNVENGVSIAVDMAQPVRLKDGTMKSGIHWRSADKRAGSRKNGWELMRNYFSQAKNPEKGVREKPGLFVTECCVNFIRTVPVLPRDPDDMDDVDTDAEDHIGDETRYFIRSLGLKPRKKKTRGGF